MILNIDNKEVKEFTNRLRRMHRSNLPIVVRQTLNDMAFDVKQNTLLKSADKEFILRNPSFFRKHSGVKKADGWDINSMKSEVGMMTTGGKGDGVVRDLNKQEFGGNIRHEARYLSYSRMGNSKTGRVRKNNLLIKKGYVRGTPSAKRGRKANFVAMAFVALREDKYLNIRSKKGKDNLLQVISISQNLKSRKIDIKLKGVAELEQKGKKLNKNPFFLPASQKSYKKQEYLYVKNAKKRLEKK